MSPNTGVVVKAVMAEKPPPYLLLGAEAYKRATLKLDALRADMEQWRDVALATDFAANSAEFEVP
jgi:hypothetical protein